MKNTCLFILVLLLSACASVKKIESGDHLVGERMSLKIEGLWNHLDYPWDQPAQVWTMEGFTIDVLFIYSGIKNEERMHPANSSNVYKKDFVFRSSMQTEEIASLFEGVFSRDGSSFKLIKLEPYIFAGRKGFRFEYERTRKFDNVRQLGVAYGAVDRGELFALVYNAPRLTFFPRHKERVERMARSVSLK